MTISPGASRSRRRNSALWLVRCPATTALPTWPGEAEPGQCPGPWLRVVSRIPSYIGESRPMLGIDIHPTWTSGSAPLVSVGGAIGLVACSGGGRVVVVGAAVVVVVVVDVVVVVVVVVVDATVVDVDGAIVAVVAGIAVVTEAAAAGGSPSPPRVATAAIAMPMARSATVTAPRPARRIPPGRGGVGARSTSLILADPSVDGRAAGDRPPVPDACRDPDSAVARSGHVQAGRQRAFDGLDPVAMVGAVLGERSGPAGDPVLEWGEPDTEMDRQVVQDRVDELLVAAVER